MKKNVLIILALVALLVLNWAFFLMNRPTQYPPVVSSFASVWFISKEGLLPQPNETLTLAEFDLLDRQAGDGYGSVCVELNGLSLIESNDSGLTEEDYLLRSSLMIGDLVLSGEQGMIVYDFLGSMANQEYDPKTNEFVPLKPNATGPLGVCWKTKLETGSHRVEYRALRTSGTQLSYTWSFELEN